MVTRIGTWSQTVLPGRVPYARPTFGRPLGIRVMRMMATAPQFAQGVDVTALTARLEPLLASSGGRWKLVSTGEGLERPFKFKTFAKTWVCLSCLRQVDFTTLPGWTLSLIFTAVVQVLTTSFCL